MSEQAEEESEGGRELRGSASTAVEIGTSLTESRSDRSLGGGNSNNQGGVQF